MSGHTMVYPNNHASNPPQMMASYSNFIETLEKMAKKPTVEDDLSGVLDNFLLKLHESRKYLTNGIFNTNFAEAALLLQSAANIYGKKVDNLWDFVLDCQHRMLKYDEKNATAKEVEKLEERMNRNRRKKKKLDINNEKNNSDKSDLKNEIKWLRKHISDPALDADIEQPNGWDVLIAEEKANERRNKDQSCDEYEKEDEHITFLPEEKYRIRISLHIDIYIQQLLPQLLILIPGDFPGDEEWINYNNFHTVNSSRDFKLSLELFTMLGGKTKLFHSDISISKIAEKFLDNYKISPDNIPNNPETLSNFLLYQNAFFGDKRNATVTAVTPARRGRCESNVSVKLYRLPDETLHFYKQKLENEFTDTFLTDLDMSIKKDCDNTLEKSVENDGYTPSKRKSNLDSGFFETFYSDNIGNDIDALSDVDLSIHNSQLVTSTPKVPNEKRKISKDDESKEPISKKKRLTSRWKKTYTVSLKAFELFYSRVYEPEQDEGTKDLTHFPELETEDFDDHDTGFASQEFINSDNNLITNNEITTEGDRANTENDGKRQEISGDDDAPLQLQTKINNTDGFAEKLMKSTMRRQRYTEWKSFIYNKLKDQTSSADYDIHEYGTKIIDTFPENKVLPFNDLMKGKSQSEVCKLFVASLQLANTYNIEFSEVPKGQLANDHLKMKLLSTERHHEHLDGYVAPSEQEYSVKLAKVHSTILKPVPEPNYEKIDFLKSVQPKSYVSHVQRKRRKIGFNDE